MISQMSSGRERFLQTGMTPRAWRMLAYSCGGFLLYGMIVLMEGLQNYHLNRVDAQMQQVTSMEAYGLETSTFTLAASSPAETPPAPE